MRIIELSSHPADALRLARQRRDHACRLGQPGIAGQPHPRDAIARHELLVRRASSARDRARAQRHWLAWLRAALAVSRLRRLAPTSAPGSGIPGGGEELRAGLPAAELQVVADLSAVLGDEWALVRGYCNQRGEIDHLLLGPPALIAIVTRHLDATIACDGDNWRFTTFDRSGNVLDQGTLGGNGARSPSVQLNEPADLLEQFLTSHGARVSMLRVVLLTHPDVRLGRCKDQTVHIATSARELAVQLDDMPPVIGAVRRARLEELIARDNRYHERFRHGADSPTRRLPPTGATRTGRSARSASR